MRKNLIVMTGAGISQESGIPTFRDSETGLWFMHDVMAVATPEGWANDPVLVNNFYDDRRVQLKDIQPNTAHIALAKLEENWKDGGFLIVTTNGDDLHEKAGSKQVCHMHGEIMSAKCSKECGYTQKVDYDTKLISMVCPTCSEQLRPDVVWFREMPYHLDMLDQILDVCDIFVGIGCGAQVMPASLFPMAVRQSNPTANIIEANLDLTGDIAYNEGIAGKATETVPDLVERLLKEYQNGN